MKLQTNIPLEKESKDLINYQSKILLLGSCFSENIGEKLNYFKFQSIQNPVGILFHPKAIENLILNAINLKEYNEDDLFFQNERFHSFDTHSSLSGANKKDVLKHLNSSIKETKNALENANHIIITLGTSWVYRFIEADKIVANCHKIPQKKFLKELLSVNEIEESLEAIISLVKSVNNNAQIIFTVSPVRHLKDGFVENMQSKAHLIAGIHQVVNTRNSVFYFPSFELMMDELRDYRFYESDMIHPNNTAILYIWEKFKTVWFSEETTFLMRKIDEVQKGIAHKPFNEKSEQHQEFLKKLKDKINTIQQEIPFIKF